MVKPHYYTHQQIVASKRTFAILSIIYLAVSGPLIFAIITPNAGIAVRLLCAVIGGGFISYYLGYSCVSSNDRSPLLTDQEKLSELTEMIKDCASVKNYMAELRERGRHRISLQDFGYCKFLYTQYTQERILSQAVNGNG